VDRAVADHAKQVLHEEHRPHDRVGKSPPLDRPLGLPVLARNLERRLLSGSENRQLHEPAGARAHSRVDDVALLFQLSTGLAREEEHAVDSGQSCLDCLRPVQVTHDVLDGVAEPGARRPWIAYERSGSLTGGGEPPEHLTADRAGRSGHQDHANQPPLLRVLTTDDDGPPERRH
jgi:hypothetical protein